MELSRTRAHGPTDDHDFVAFRVGDPPAILRLVKEPTTSCHGRGEARLGEDTQLGQGSRAPELLPPLILGQGFLAEGYIAPGHPQNARERNILGRDAIFHHRKN